MRDLLQYMYDTGLGNTVDAVIGYLCLAMEIAVGQWLAKKLNIKWWAALILTGLRWFIGGNLSAFIYDLHNGFTANSGFLTMSYVYIPLILAPVYLLFRIKWRTACDYLAITLAVFQWPIHIGCIFKSCCHGYESAFGIWNAYLGAYVFPIQIVNVITALLTACLLIFIMKRAAFRPTGTLYPILLVLHGTERFLLDFCRGTRKDIFGMTYAQLHAAFMIVVGVAVLSIMWSMYKKSQHVSTKTCKK